MKWLRYFVLLLPLIFSVSFSFSADECTERKDVSCAAAGLHGLHCVRCYTYENEGCFKTPREACEAHGYDAVYSHVNLCAYRGDNNKVVSFGGHYSEKYKVFGTPDPYSCPDNDDDDPCGNGKDPATCDLNDDDDPCKINPAACVFDDDDPCGNGKDPETCDMEDPQPDDPEPPKYDDDYKPDDPPCQIMVNGKCYNANTGNPYDPDNPADPNNPSNPNSGNKNRICSNGYCKCFKKNENGILKEVSCNDSNFYDASCSDPYDPETCSDNWQEDMFPEMEDMPDYNPNSQYDDATYNFDDLDTSTKLPDAKDIKDKTQEVDLSSWGVNDYFNSSGQCPAPNTVSLGMFGSFEVSYEYFCSIARILRTVVIAFAWLTGLLIIAKINK